MRFTSSIAAAALVGGVAQAAPYAPFPLADGFPSPNPAQLAQIQATAGGSLPDGPLPTSLKPAGVTTLQLIALNEIFEVAYFNDLLTNVTTGVPGYDVEALGFNKTYVVNTLTAVRAVSLPKLHYFRRANFLPSKKNSTLPVPTAFWPPLVHLPLALARTNSPSPTTSLRSPSPRHSRTSCLAFSRKRKPSSQQMLARRLASSPSSAPSLRKKASKMVGTAASSKRPHPPHPS